MFGDDDEVPGDDEDAAEHVAEQDHSDAEGDAHDAAARKALAETSLEPVEQRVEQERRDAGDHDQDGVTAEEVRTDGDREDGGDRERPLLRGSELRLHGRGSAHFASMAPHGSANGSVRP
jgi:hypothetical protein